VAKTSGLGDNFYAGGFDLSGDTQSLDKIHGGTATQQDTTDITQLGHARLGLERDGGIDWTSYMDPAVGASHAALSTLPTAAVICSYFRGTAIGNPAASLVSKQINYDGSRPSDGSLLFKVSAQSNAFGLEWGNQLTAGKRTDTVATAGAFWDNLASFAFGAQAYLQVFSFTGTDVTVKVQHATTSGGSYSDLITFAQITSGQAPQAQRVQTANNVTVNEFLKVTTVTTGGFSNLVFAVMVNVNPVLGVVF